MPKKKWKMLEIRAEVKPLRNAASKPERDEENVQEVATVVTCQMARWQTWGRKGRAPRERLGWKEDHLCGYTACPLNLE